MAKFYYIAPVEFSCPEDPITLGDSKFEAEMPWDGEILGAVTGPKIDGFILNAGTGAGSATQIQIRNVDTGRDYFTTMPEFRVDSKDAANRAPLEGGAIGVHPMFKGGEFLALDIDGLPTNADSAEAYLWLTCGFWREVL